MCRLMLAVLLLALGSALAGPVGAALAQDGSAAIIATFAVGDETFRVRIDNPATIDQVRALERGESTAAIPNGRLLAGADGNEPWSWHLDSVDIEMAEVTIELCDGTPSMVEAGLDYWLNTVGRYCPWSAQLVSVEDVGAIAPTATTEPPPTATVAALPATGQGPEGSGRHLLAAVVAAAGALPAAALALRWVVGRWRRGLPGLSGKHLGREVR